MYQCVILLVIFLQVCSSFNSLGKKYHAVNKAASWLEAEQACEQENGRLVSISSEYELRTVFDEAKDLSGDFWTSGSNLNHPNRWSWIDQTYITYNNYAFGFPKYDDSRSSCVYVEKSTGLWKSDDCFTSKKNYVCQTDHRNASDWQYFSETKAYYKALEMGNNWDGYESLCVKDGGHLASVHSDEESDIVKFLGTAIDGCRYVTIGLHSSVLMSLHKNFTWSDGSEMDFEKWPATGAFPTGSFICGYMEMSRNIWLDQSCGGLLDSCAVCKKLQAS